MRKQKRLKFDDSGLTREDWSTLKRLDTPTKVQDFLNTLPFNHDTRATNQVSVEQVLESRKAHCFEGALFSACALWIQGQRPLLLDLVADEPDDDHVVALFQVRGKWGAVSKTNHPVLRYREPIYRDVRELAMSYFHEYYLSDGRKTLRKYSKPFDLSRFGTSWIKPSLNPRDLAEALDRSPHYEILTPSQIRQLRRADRIERQATDLVEWKKL